MTLALIQGQTVSDTIRELAQSETTKTISAGFF